MGIWDELRSRLLGDGERLEEAPASQEDLAPQPPLRAGEGETSGLLPLSAPERGLGGEVSLPDVVAARQERAAGRILDDEGLRGELSDDEYQPLVDWALIVIDRVTTRTAELDDEQAEATIDGGIGVVRAVVRPAGDAILAHNEGRAEDRRWALDEVSQAWRPSIVGGDDGDLSTTLWRPLQQLADHLDAEPELPGADVAAAIIAALPLPAACDDAPVNESAQAAETIESTGES